MNVLVVYDLMMTEFSWDYVVMWICMVKYAIKMWIAYYLMIIKLNLDYAVILIFVVNYTTIIWIVGDFKEWWTWLLK